MATNGNRGRRIADEKLLLSLACGATIQTAAKQSGMSERTAHRRLKDAAFAKQLSDLKAEMVKRTTAKLSALGAKAVTTLQDLMDKSIKPEVRLGSAKAVLEIGCKWREVGEQAKQIEEIEATLAELEAEEKSRNR